MYLFARALQFLGLLITGVGFFDGLIGGHVRRELVFLAAGAAMFLMGRWLQMKR